MALGRRYIHQAKIVFADDPAIEDGYDEYREAGFDWPKLKLRAGEEPTVIVIKPLTYRQRELMGGLPTGEVITHLFRCGVIEVRNYQTIVRYDDGREVAGVLAPVEHERDGAAMVVSREWLEAAHLPPEHVGEIAGAIAELSQHKLPLAVRSVRPDGPDGSRSSSASAGPPFVTL